MSRMKRAINMMTALAVTIGLSQLAAVTPAAAQNQCTLYANQVCWNYWDEMGYSSVGECKLAEYARCVENGGPPEGYPWAGLVVRETVKPA